MQHGLRATRKTPFVATTVRVAAGLALLSSLSAHAQFQVFCDDSTATTGGNGSLYEFCAGPLPGLLNGVDELGNLNTLLGAGNWKTVGKSNDANSSPFVVNPAGQLVGNLNFKVPINGVLAIGLQGAPDLLGDSWYSFYRFDTGTSGVSSLRFDTMGLYRSLAGSGSRSPQLAFASLYLLNPVPEPTTTALLVGGLGVLAWVARRRAATGRPAGGDRTA